VGGSLCAFKRRTCIKDLAFRSLGNKKATSHSLHIYFTHCYCWFSPSLYFSVNNSTLYPLNNSSFQILSETYKLPSTMKFLAATILSIATLAAASPFPQNANRPVPNGACCTPNTSLKQDVCNVNGQTGRCVPSAANGCK